jgi:hypothetical protein
MKTWKIVLASLAALLIMVVAPLSATAASTTPAANEKPALQGALALIAPHVVRPGENFTVTVLLRKNQSPMEGVAIWEVSKTQADSLKKALKPAAGKKAVIPQAWQDLLEEQGNLLGHTDANGKLACSLDEINNYILVAVKPGYRPDFSPLFVRQVLAIEAPKSATAGEDFNLGVFIRGSEEAVSEAGVWAVKMENPAGLKGKLAQLKQAYKENFQESDWEKLLDKKAISLGKTDQNGKLSASLETAGKYILITVKKGFVPGFAPIAITENVPAD